jgi:putative membrane protein
MALIANILIGVVALLHVWFMALEMFLWTKPRGLRVFKQSLEKAQASAVLAANQGLYNGFLAAGLFWSLYQSVPVFAFQLKAFFLSCVLLAGIYGGITASRGILIVQALPAAVALLFLVASRA